MKTIIPLLESWLVPAILWTAALSLLALFFVSKKRGAFLQVVYLVRYPLIFALMLLLLPLVAITSQSRMLGNIFTFDSIGAIALVVLIAIWVAWTVMYTLNLVLYELPEIYGLPNYLTILGAKLGSRWPGKYRVWLFALLAAPVAIISVLKAEVSSQAGVSGKALSAHSVQSALIGVALGALAAGLIYWLSSRMLATEWMNGWLDNFRNGMRTLFSKMPESSRKGFRRRTGTDFRHESGAIFLIILAAFYVIGAFLFSPDQHRVVIPPAPAAVYILSLLLILTWVFSGLAHVVDRYRVPTSLIILVLSIIVATISDTNHYYRLVQQPPPAPATAQVQQDLTPATPAAQIESSPPPEEIETKLTFEQMSPIQQSDLSYTSTLPLPNAIFQARQGNQVTKGHERGEPALPPNEPPPLVIIMASGGGISAAVWTAQVLTGLQAQLHEKYVDAIGLISAVSGGAIGTMYYVDGFTKAAPPPDSYLQEPDSYLQEIVTKAGESTVEQAAWGLIYPDLGRTFFLTSLFPRQRFHDRSWAMETAWQGRLQDLAKRHNEARDAQISKEGLYTTYSFTDTHVPTNTRMLLDWQAGVTEGWRPATIFNATEAETGERFLFATAQIPITWTTRTFYNAFPGYDLPVATAARMAATFPYITPLAHAYLSESDLITIAVRLGLTETDPITTVTGTIVTTHTEIITHTEQVENWDLADGGYFDNDGVFTALQWLEMNLATRDPQDRPRRIVLIQILAAPRATNVERCDAEKAKQPFGSSDMYSKIDPPQQTEERAVRSGWVNEFFGPVLTLLNTWGTSQVERGQNEIDHFIELKRGQYQEDNINPKDNLEILYCVFDLRKTDVLSWQLAHSEFDEIIKAWTESDIKPEDRRIQPRIDQIRQFLNIPED